jgi:hypothetical protein
MPSGTRVWVRRIEPNGDGETTNVLLEVYRPRQRQSIEFSFNVKRSNSFDQDVEAALAELAETVAEVQVFLAERKS